MVIKEGREIIANLYNDDAYSLQLENHSVLRFETDFLLVFLCQLSLEVVTNDPACTGPIRVKAEKSRSFLARSSME